MSQPTDQYYIIKEFLHEGNRYAPSTRPYLYGELLRLPKHLLENRNFIVPANEATVKSEIISNGVTELTPIEGERKIQQEVVTVKLKEPEVEVEVEKNEIVEEVEVKPTTSTTPTRKRKAV